MVGFVITSFEALLFIAMAAIVLYARRDSYVNRYFSLTLLCIALWLFSGFIDRVITNPSVDFVTIQYRTAYATATLAISFFFLFAYGFFLGNKPRRILTRIALSLCVVLFITCFTDLIIKRAELIENSYLVTTGLLYYSFICCFFALGITGLLFITLKTKHSRSIDRARALYILIGFGVFFLLSFILSIVLPSIMARDVTSDYAFIAVIIPAAFTAYAILKYHLLDVRLALRRGFAYAITIVLFCIPIIAVYFAFKPFWTDHATAEKAFFLIYLALAIVLTPTVRRLTEKLATRLLFASMYSEIELLHQVSSIFTATPNIREGIGKATTLVCKELHLENLAVVIPREIISGKGEWLVGSMNSGTSITDFHKVNLTQSPLYKLGQPAIVKGDIASDSPESEVASELIHELETMGLIACLPITGTLGEVGILLVGEKLQGAALDPADLSFLNHFSERSGIFIENYLLSTYLLAQLEEARQVQKKIEELDHFKTDIINVTSHEFRTPLTILNGYAYMLREHYDKFSPEQREGYIQNIVDSCDRLNSILSQFITISFFQRKELQVSAQTMPLKELFDDIHTNLSREDSSRLMSLLEPNDIMVSADRSYLVMLLRNLVDNAIRFSPPESPVIMKAKLEDERVCISVRDFGVGINPSEARNIFNPFDRLENVDNHQIGTGLGLYIVRLIADLLETEIDVQTQPGQGAEFSFRLPIFGPV